MSNDTVYVTKDGLEKLSEELRLLKTKGRSEIARQIQEAREKGDLSENAEYDAAKDAQGHLEAKISRLENSLANAKIIDTGSMDTSKVMIMSTVKVMNHTSSKEVTYKLVSETEASMKEGKISIKSPIGQALIGKVIGDTFEVSVPAGKLKFEVLEITI
jgi:transcription elongation factor GreA